MNSTEQQLNSISLPNGVTIHFNKPAPCASSKHNWCATWFCLVIAALITIGVVMPEWGAWFWSGVDRVEGRNE